MGILNKILYSIIIANCLTGCYRVYTGDFEATPVLSINSLINAGQPIDISLTHTWAYPSQSYELMENRHNDNAVTDAKIEIYVNGTLQDDDYIPKEGDHIRVVANSKTYGTAEAEVEVPVSIPLESIEWEASLISKGYVEDWYGSYYSVKFKLTAKVTIFDENGKSNYYHLEYLPLYNSLQASDEDEDTSLQNFSTGELKYQSEPLFSEHISMMDYAVGMESYGFTFFTDSQFMGKSYTLNLVFDNMTLVTSDEHPDVSELDWSVSFVLNYISESLYNLANYQWQTMFDTISDIGEIGLAEPTAGYSNVSTGAGVLAAQSSATYNINLKDFFISEMGQ